MLVNLQIALLTLHPCVARVESFTRTAQCFQIRLECDHCKKCPPAEVDRYVLQSDRASRIYSIVSIISRLFFFFFTFVVILKTPNNEIVCLRSRGASSCDWRSFPTQPGPARPGGGHHHRSGARVSRPVVVVVVVVLSARVHGLRPPCSWLSCLLCMFTELESNEHSGSQLRPFQQPSAPQLSSPPPTPLLSIPDPCPQPCAGCQRRSCARSSPVAWLIERRGRPRQQLPLSSFDHLRYPSLSSP